LREWWDPAIKPVIKYAQDRMLKLMASIAPLFPIKMTVAELANYCVMDIGEK